MEEIIKKEGKEIPQAHESEDGNDQSQTTNTCSSIVAEMEKLQEEVALKREETSALRQQQLREEETKVEAILQNLNQQRLLNARLLFQHSCHQQLLDLLIRHFLGD
ncbi:uncharacterized protein [Gossypium hirsutum]|uniref:Uncharacterized protein isoform X2 n=1 Tax=Gossypium hirsutum TaxID=3635 RepID=A0A1U8JL80_GOSHI|nr:uncharacterized protein LOC107908369 isoform X2 [Gossypium hirsutum]